MLQGHLDLVRTIQFKGNMLVSGSYDCMIKIWFVFCNKRDIEKQECVLDIGGHTSRVFKVMFDERRLYSCSQDSRVYVHDFEGI